MNGVGERSFGREAPAVFAAVLWGANYPMVKLLLSGMPEGEFLALRFLATTAILATYLAFSGEGIRFDRRHAIRIVVLGVLGVGVYNIVWTLGLHRTSSFDAALIIATSPIFAELYATFSGEERISSFRWIGTFVAFGGIAAVVAGAPVGGRTSSLAGDALLFAGSILFAFYAVAARPLLRHYSPLKLTTLAMAGGLPVLLPFALMASPSAGWTAPNSLAWGEMGYVVLFGTVAAYVLWYDGVKHAGAVRTALYLYIVPVTSAFFGAFMLGESFGAMRLIGAALVLVGLVVVKWEKSAAISGRAEEKTACATGCFAKGSKAASSKGG